MAGEDRIRPADLDIETWLERESPQLDFFQALRLLECSAPSKPRVGCARHHWEDLVRLGQEVSLAFPTSTVASYARGRADDLPALRTRFFGLFGPNGALPLHLTEYAYQRQQREDDPSLADFVDVFHHRMLCFFYRAWANAQPTVSHDRPREDSFARYVASLFGYGLEEMRGPGALPEPFRLYFAGHLACHTHHPAGLEAMITGYFGVPARCEEFVGDWLALPDEYCCRLEDQDRAGVLGESSVLGERVWSAHHMFRLVLGPLSREDFDRFLPGGARLGALAAIVHSYCTADLSWELRLCLEREDVPPLLLDGQQSLGWTTWLHTVPTRHADDVTFEPTRYLVATEAGGS